MEAFDFQERSRPRKPSPHAGETDEPAQSRVRKRPNLAATLLPDEARLLFAHLDHVFAEFADVSASTKTRDVRCELK